MKVRAILITFLISASANVFSMALAQSITHEEFHDQFREDLSQLEGISNFSDESYAFDRVIKLLDQVEDANITIESDELDRLMRFYERAKKTSDPLSTQAYFAQQLAKHPLLPKLQAQADEHGKQKEIAREQQEMLDLMDDTQSLLSLTFLSERCRADILEQVSIQQSLLNSDIELRRGGTGGPAKSRTTHPENENHSPRRNE